MDPKLLFLTRARKFSGKSGDNWDTWISHFEAQTITFDDAGRLQCLLSLLDDDALDAFIAIPAKVKVKYDTAKKSLDARFGRTIDRLQALAELNKSTQATGESVEKFGERLRKLGKLAYPQAIEGDKTAESSITCRFICGLRDEWIRLSKYFHTARKTRGRDGAGVAAPGRVCYAPMFGSCFRDFGADTSGELVSRCTPSIYGNCAA